MGTAVLCPVCLHAARAPGHGRPIQFGVPAPPWHPHSHVHGSRPQWLPWVLWKGSGRRRSVLQWEAWGHTGWPPGQGGRLVGKDGGRARWCAGLLWGSLPRRHWGWAHCLRLGLGPLLSIDWADVVPLSLLLCPPALCGRPQRDSASSPFPRPGFLRAGLCMSPLRSGVLQRACGPVHPHSLTCARSAFPAPARGAGSHGPQGKDKHVVRSPRVLLVPDLL